MKETDGPIMGFQKGYTDSNGAIYDTEMSASFCKPRMET